MGRYIAKNPRGNAHCGWMQEPWTCPKCSRTMKAAGKGPHTTNCGADLEARFWAKVDSAGGPDACWPWTAARLPVEVGGYGWANVGGKLMGAHRHSWVFTNGPIPDGMQVLHRCDNGPCCNPAHFFLGTSTDNMADKIAKNRQARGETSPKAKLTEQAVREIRRDFIAECS